ncbi:hypothetical protein IMSAGC020_00950 [Lachnospiraceae bacterium]|nr:hypothetical protein IMSAGC020_00950 [Lachnospiraceae bacterium]
MRLKEKKTLSRIILVALGSCFITGCNTKSSVKQLPEREIVEQVDDNSEETIGSVLDVVGFKVYDAIEGFREYDVILKNNSNQTINTVSVNVQYLDENGNIVETSYPQVPVRVQHGQSIAIEGVLEEKDNIVAMTADYCSFYTENGEYVESSFESIPEPVSLKESGDTYFMDSEEFSNSPINHSVKLGESEDLLNLKNIQFNGDDGFGFISYGMVIQNDTEETINTITLDVIYLDVNGNISGTTYPQEGSNVAPGQSITIEGIDESGKYAYVTVDGYSYYTNEGEYVSGYFSEIPQAIVVGDITSGTNETNTSKVKEAYDKATNLTVNDLTKNSIGGYEYNGLSIVETDREWIANSLNDKGTVEAGALYRSMATQLEGYTFASYNSWKGSVVPVLFGFDKPEMKDELNPYIDNVKDYIVLDKPFKKVMDKLASLSCIEGTLNIDTGEYDFRITDLTQASKEMQITEEGLGYILAMINEYGATVEFVDNSYSCKMVNPKAE